MHDLMCVDGSTAIYTSPCWSPKPLVRSLCKNESTSVVLKYVLSSLCAIPSTSASNVFCLLAGTNDPSCVIVLIPFHGGM